MPLLTERTFVNGVMYEKGTDPGSTVGGYIPHVDAWDNAQPYGGYPSAVAKSGPVEIMGRWDSPNANGTGITAAPIDLGFDPTDGTLLMFQFGDINGGRLWQSVSYLMSEATAANSLFAWSHDNDYLTINLSGPTEVTITDVGREAVLHSVVLWA